MTRPALLAYLRTYIAANDDTPSLGEIATAMHMTKPRVVRELRRLERDGLLTRLPAPARQKRRIVLIEHQERAVDTLRRLGWKLIAP